MDINQIKKLIKIIENSTLNEVEIEEGNLRIKVSKSAPESSHPMTYQHILPPPPPPAQAPVQQQVQAQTAPAAEEIPQAPAEKEQAQGYEIVSPIVGTFYRSPAPDADPYVKEGDRIKPGDVLCIVEAMKLMNEIESDVSGTILKILAENGKPVEYNQPMFIIKTD